MTALANDLGTYADAKRTQHGFQPLPNLYMYIVCLQKRKTLNLHTKFTQVQSCLLRQFLKNYTEPLNMLTSNPGTCTYVYVSVQ